MQLKRRLEEAASSQKGCLLVSYKIHLFVANFHDCVQVLEHICILNGFDITGTAFLDLIVRIYPTPV